MRRSWRWSPQNFIRLPRGGGGICSWLLIGIRLKEAAWGGKREDCTLFPFLSVSRLANSDHCAQFQFTFATPFSRHQFLYWPQIVRNVSWNLKLSWASSAMQWKEGGAGGWRGHFVCWRRKVWAGRVSLLSRVSACQGIHKSANTPEYNLNK